jgi:3-hydroxyacyl-[acyl-carrier-protein] dehydratase
MDINKIRETIPHRYPFLLVDRVLEIDIAKNRLVAIKNVTANEQYFMGHYPDRPIMPGVLLIEVMAQAAAVFMLSVPQNKGKIPYFTGIEAAKFRRVVVPGDQLRIEIDFLRLKSRAGRTAARCLVDGNVVAEAILTCMLGDPDA